ncbi:DNA sulfur modification protein DndB [Streptomyces olivoreticuli]|uniref:DNA sulfur modification protein DndB n=1 Tax=Streptomyces olivoreticuli TaxID=68246 RepID=UPI00265B6298|nr:DNA sulfur modification protein DndB [Streptomyces olivoreticuli]WKK21342.1 DNA sulfur modification protein DndB [Streptomyces olivoreticuli]
MGPSPSSKLVDTATSAGFDYIFPAIRGVQAGREFYVSMCPLRFIPKIFLFDDDELAPEVRAQRTLNKGRLPALTRYIVENPDDYVFSALTASVDGEIRFESISDSGMGMRAGQIRIPMAARFLINDGQHRRAAIEQALKENPDLGEETIAVVFFHDAGLARCQQMFADLNRHAVRPQRSIGVLYDHRDDLAIMARLLAMKSPVFKGHVDLENSTLAQRSRKLFTLSALASATQSLLHGLDLKKDKAQQLAEAFWESVDPVVPEWGMVRRRELAAPEVRKDYIHSHGIALHALGRIGNSLLRTSESPKVWESKLRPLTSVDWSRTNPDWEGRAMIGGRVSKSHQNLTLTVNYLRRHMKLELSPEEQRVEDAYLRGVS